MKDTMFRRIGAFALAGMLAMSLMAAPAMAAETAGKSTITVNEVIPGVTYKAYQLLRLVDYDRDVPEGGTIGWYKYEIPAATDPDDTIRPLLLQLIGDGGAFAAVRDDGGNVTGAGFEVSGSDVMFWTPTAGGKTAQESRTDWDAASQEAYMTRFAEALRKLVDTTAGLKETASRTVAEADKTVVFDGLEQGYWLATSSAGTRSMVFTNPGTDGAAASITEKNKAPTLDKKAYDQSGKWVSENDVNIGDRVYYSVEIDAPAGTENLSLVDTLTEGLTFVEVTEVTFYPRGTDPDVKNALGKPARKAFHNSEADGELSDHISLMGGDSIDLTSTTVLGGTFDEANKLHVTVRDPDGTDGKDTQQLKIAFDNVFLKSLRANEANADTYDQLPMETGDGRLEGTADDAAVAANYNVFLGDMDTQEDDGGTIVVKYTARLNEKAVMTADPQKNSAKLTFGHDPRNPHETDKGPDGETPESETKTYTYDLSLYKYAAGNSKQGLSGAQFSIGRMPLSIVKSDFDAGDKLSTVKYGTYHAVDPAMVKAAGADVNYTALDADKANADLISVVDITEAAIAANLASDGDRVYRLAVDGDTGTTTTVESGASGKIIVKGLDSNLYVIYEDKAPEGYAALDRPVFATLGSQVAGIGGKLFIEDVKKAEDSGATRVFMAAATGENGSSINGNTLQIANNSGAALPTTGGIGTTIFYVSGIALVLGAGALLAVKKRTGGGEE